MEQLTNLNALLKERHPDSMPINSMQIKSYVGASMSVKQVSILKSFMNGTNVAMLKNKYAMAESRVRNTLYHGVDIIYTKQREELELCLIKS